MLEVTFTPTADDMVAFFTHALKRSPEVRRQIVRSWVVIPTGVCLLALGLWVAGVYPPVAIGLAISGVVVALLFPLIGRSWIGQWASQHARQHAVGGIGRLTVTLTEDEFRVKGDVTTTTARWEKMKGVVSVPDHTFIYLTDQFAVVVPRLALESDTQYAAVRDFTAARLAQLA